MDEVDVVLLGRVVCHDLLSEDVQECTLGKTHQHFDDLRHDFLLVECQSSEKRPEAGLVKDQTKLLSLLWQDERLQGDLSNRHAFLNRDLVVSVVITYEPE